MERPKVNEYYTENKHVDQRTPPIRISSWLMEEVKDTKRAWEKRDRRIYSYAEILDNVWKDSLISGKLSQSNQKAIKVIKELKTMAETLQQIATNLSEIVIKLDVTSEDLEIEDEN